MLIMVFDEAEKVKSLSLVYLSFSPSVKFLTMIGASPIGFVGVPAGCGFCCGVGGIEDIGGFAIGAGVCGFIAGSCAAEVISVIWRFGATGEVLLMAP